jgi:hypothetical protein
MTRRTIAKEEKMNGSSHDHRHSQSSSAEEVYD